MPVDLLTPPDGKFPSQRLDRDFHAIVLKNLSRAG